MSEYADKIYAEVAQQLGAEWRAEAAEAKKGLWSKVIAKRNGVAKSKADAAPTGWAKVVGALNARRGL